MLQVIKREFRKLKDLVQYINDISIKYGYLKDYQILKENEKYNLFLSFNVPECNQFLELAKLKQEISEDHLLYKTNYILKSEDKSSNICANIYCRDLRNGFEVNGNFGYDGMFNLININYDLIKDYFLIELRKFEYDRSIIGWHTHVDDTLFVENVDHKIIYNHLVKLIFNRGYLIDKFSLKELEDNLYYIAKWLNKKCFNEE
ncbi:hypothetical protein FDB40_17155 [Clostridium botulinum]|nr:hypothetical protein [Clostridium botulinum]